MAVFTAPDGATLHYSDEGRGPAVLALAGLTRNSADFDYVAPHLGGCRLIRLDYRGRGRSDWTGPETYTIPVEAADALALLDHLGLEKAAILGTSRGGLIGMLIAATARPRISGLLLNDIGPVIETAGLDVISGYVGRNPAARTFAEAASIRANLLSGFANVPEDRWQDDARRQYVRISEGLRIYYDPELRDAVEAARQQPVPDLWPVFDALAGLPLGVIRGAGSNILSAATVAEMRARRPDLITAEVADRGHAPFLDEPEALEAIWTWLEKLQ